MLCSALCLLQESGEDLELAIVDDDLSFSKDRTISRLLEMGSSEYLLSHARRHVPCLVLALEEKREQPRERKSAALHQESEQIAATA